MQVWTFIYYSRQWSSESRWGPDLGTGNSTSSRIQQFHFFHFVNNYNYNKIHPLPSSSCVLGISWLVQHPQFFCKTQEVLGMMSWSIFQAVIKNSVWLGSRASGRKKYSYWLLQNISYDWMELRWGRKEEWSTKGSWKVEWRLYYWFAPINESVYLWFIFTYCTFHNCIYTMSPSNCSLKRNQHQNLHLNNI